MTDSAPSERKALKTADALPSEFSRTTILQEGDDHTRFLPRLLEQRLARDKQRMADQRSGDAKDQEERKGDSKDQKVAIYSPNFVRVCSPMVRYSKLPFRLLARQYGADIASTPMIIASGFNRSQACRDSEFSTCLEDQPLIVQFAANDPVELGMAAEKCLTAVHAIDLNCGCPQKWAVHEGIGAALSRQPQLVAEMVAETRKRVHNFPLAIKIRILPDLRQTIDLVQRAEKAGVSWITVHGRTPAERHTPVHYDAIAAIKAVAKVPIVANGDIFRVADMERVVKETKVDGVMLARGALANPAVFGGLDAMPLQCPVDYLRYALEYGGLFKIHHHHLAYMSFAGFTRAEQREFSGLSSLAGVIDFFSRRGWWPSADSQATSSAGASGSKAAAVGASSAGGVGAGSAKAGSEVSTAGAGAAGSSQCADQQTEKTGSQTA